MKYRILTMKNELFQVERKSYEGGIWDNQHVTFATEADALNFIKGQLVASYGPELNADDL